TPRAAPGPFALVAPSPGFCHRPRPAPPMTPSRRTTTTPVDAHHQVYSSSVPPAGQHGIPNAMPTTAHTPPRQRGNALPTRSAPYYAPPSTSPSVTSPPSPTMPPPERCATIP